MEICPVSMRHFGVSWLVVYILGGVRCGRCLLYILRACVDDLWLLYPLVWSMDRGNISATIVPEL